MIYRQFNKCSFFSCNICYHPSVIFICKLREQKHYRLQISAQENRYQRIGTSVSAISED